MIVSSTTYSRYGLRLAGAVAVSLFLGFFFTSISPGSENVSGAVRVVDADTLRIGKISVRLAGIDAPETDQLCLDANGKNWACGVYAKEKLQSLIGNSRISCAVEGYDRRRRAIAECLFGGKSVNSWLVSRGLALSYTRFSTKFAPEELLAKNQKLGLWAGAFIAPWDWRSRNQSTTIHGALSVPIDAQARLLASVSSLSAPSGNCLIKGNVNRAGERIYHLPGSKTYERINMEKGAGRRWFCTVEDAVAAGWRPAKQ